MMKLKIRLGFLLLVLSGVNLFGSNGQEQIRNRHLVWSISHYSFEIGGGKGSAFTPLFLGALEANRKHCVHHVNLSKQIKEMICNYASTSDTRNKLEHLAIEKGYDESNIFGQNMNMSTEEYWRKKNQLEALYCSRLLLFSCKIMKESMSESDMNIHLKQALGVSYPMKDVENLIKSEALDFQKQLFAENNKKN